MNEAELAEKFNRELDALLAGAPAGRYCDEGAMKTAAALAAADFSGDSLVREELRARLAPERYGALSVLRYLLANNFARAALAAACLAVALLPLLRRAERPAVTAVPSRQETAAVPARPPAGKLPAPPRALFRPAAAPKPDPGLFTALPMPRLEGRRLAEFPIAAAGAGSPIVRTAGRRLQVENGSGIAWETDAAVFELRRRPTSNEEIFEVRSL